MSNNLFGKDHSVKRPPSLSYKTLTNFLEGFQRKDIPSHIDKNILPSSMSGGNQAYLMNALKFLGLISENNSPQEKFYKLARAEHSMRFSTWREILQNSYGFVMNDFDLSNATTQAVVDKFKEQGLTDGNVLRKAILFFLNAVQAAEIQVSPKIQLSEVSRLVKTPRTGKTSESGELIYKLIDLLDEEMNETEENAVWTLIRYLKRKKRVADEARGDSEEVEP